MILRCFCGNQTGRAGFVYDGEGVAFEVFVNGIKVWTNDSDRMSRAIQGAVLHPPGDPVRETPNVKRWEKTAHQFRPQEGRSYVMWCPRHQAVHFPEVEVRRALRQGKRQLKAKRYPRRPAKGSLKPQGQG